MTVAELIEKLKQYPSDYQVWIYSDYGSDNTLDVGPRPWSPEAKTLIGDDEW